MSDRLRDLASWRADAALGRNLCGMAPVLKCSKCPSGSQELALIRRNTWRPQQDSNLRHKV